MYHNYGDKDFFEHGLLVDTEHSDTIFDMLVCYPYSDIEDQYQFAHIVVDITDTWINREAVTAFSGTGNDDPVQFAIACLEYYGPQEFGADSINVTFDWRYMERESIRKELRGYLIAHDEVEF